MAVLLPVLSILLLATGCSAGSAHTPLNLLLLPPPTGPGHVEDSSWSCCRSSASDDGGILTAVQLALDHVNRNCSVLENYVLNVTLHQSSEVHTV